MAIELLQQNIPRAICPNCKKVLLVDLDLYKRDITKIIESKCPACGGVIYTGLLIVSNNRLDKLGRHIQQIVQLTANANKSNIIQG
jgi:predicted RNA-binding Zn-ribbon protein involved in translation (DUF1610 family)